MSPRAFTRTAVLVVGFASLALVASLGLHTRADDKDEKPQPPKAKYTPAERKAWTTSKVVGSPEPPPKYKSVRAYPNAKFEKPLLFARCPGTERVFIGEQAGAIYSLADNAGAKPELFFDLRKDYAKLIPHPKAKALDDLYGLVFHPEFQKNRYCYVCYTLKNKDSNDGFLPDTSRVSRFTVTDADPPKLDPATEEIVIAFQGGGHNGGDLHFGPDGMLYISTGDGRGPNPPDQINTGQDCSDLLSSILRIDVNAAGGGVGEPAGGGPNKRDAGKNYAVPKDNPFVGMKDVRPEIWAFGFRNPWRMSFDRKTGDLWVGDVGWEQWEMVYKVAKGANYGWSVVEGRNPVKPSQKLGPAPISPPTIEIPHTLGASVTGGYVYRGKQFPELDGAYIFGDWETRRIWAATFNSDGRLKEMPELVKPNVRPSAFGENNSGQIFYLDYDNGYVYTIDRNADGVANAAFPTKLSDTGLFADVAKLTPADGVVAFYPNVRQWQDGATADYLVALPNGASVRVFDKPRRLPGQVFWHEFGTQFPAGAVLVKTISLDVVEDKTRGERRVETQILHYDGEDWRGYSYAWRKDQTDADLVPIDGAETTFNVPLPLVRGGLDSFKAVPTREQVWTFHSRAQCNSCHNAWSEYALAFTPRQLNRVPLFGGGTAPNQLVRLTHEGYVKRITADDKERPAFSDEEAAKQPKLAPLNSEDPLGERARSYLHVNCAHCHRFGGGGGQVVLELDVTKPLKDTGIFDVKPRQGDFGLPDARIVAPGDPFRSVLFYRMAKFGRGRMPHLGSEFPHAQGLNLIGEWIAGLSEPPQPWDRLPQPQPEDAGRAVKSFPMAWPFVRELARNGETKWRRALLAEAEKLEPGTMRELFDGHFPTDPKGRKLGASPRPAPILALPGDAKKGELLFFSKELKCANCHKVGDKGNAVGPDLSAIGKTRTRAELLDSLLNPSARVEPQYAAYNVRTKDEKALTGLVVKRDDKQLVLRDAENKEVVIAGDNVESVRPSRLSLMPDGLLAGLTANEAADLLEFLVQRK